MRDHAGEGHAAIGVKVYEILIGRCPKDAPEQTYTFRVFSSWHAPDHLINIDVEAKIALDDLARKTRHGNG